MNLPPTPLLEPEDLGDLPRRDIMLVHVAEAAAYHHAHLPGALLVEPRELLSGQPPAPGSLPELPRLEALFARLAYAPDAHIVVYDDEGGGWAGRFIWTLDIIGHRHWSYLNGGIHAWAAAGRPLERGHAHTPQPTTVSLAVDRQPIAELADLLAAMNEPGQVIWDVRSAEEYRGEKSGSRRAGHIPTAVNLDWLQLKDPARNLRLTRDLPGLLEAHGISRDKTVITHCQAHHRSGLSYLVARLLNMTDVRAYPGAWAEWGSRDDTPVVQGAAPGRAPDHTGNGSGS
ncbi:MAG: rhodanese-like domain-containing protein [Gammaproteobacteria bacterium]|nr:rhodanese-like domain-containing protein [Gammaproteobacteria bacterium]